MLAVRQDKKQRDVEGTQRYADKNSGGELGSKVSFLPLSFMQRRCAMKCSKCDGMLFQEWVFCEGRHIIQLRCLCGERLDAQILLNRRNPPIQKRKHAHPANNKWH